ncbi:MAG: helix-turn-helix domain-containing protein [Acidimicrobiia bacterium]|jgi:excisionase family DNA binding protein
MEPVTHPLTLTVEQTAKVLGIGRSTAYDLVRTGDIPSLRLGRRLVIPAAALADALDLPLEVIQQAAAPVLHWTASGRADNLRRSRVVFVSSPEPPGA